jgi:RimJ/RimL family protein N-acetyltransferase
MNVNLHWRELLPSDVTQAYVDWFRNPDVVRYSDNQYRSFTLDGQIEYVKACTEDSNVLLLGIFDDMTHVGCLLISGLCSPHLRCEISYVIGNSQYWGLGIATKSVKYAIHYLKTSSNVKKIVCGAAGANIASQRVLEKCGFQLEAVKRNHLLYQYGFDTTLEYCIFLK